MIRKEILAITLFFSFFITQAQEEYINEIVDNICKCIGEKKASNPDISSEELGVCLLSSAKDYKDEISKDYNIDWNNLNGEDGEKLGEILGVQLAFSCPELIVELSDSDDDFITYSTIGEVTNITIEPFIIFEVKNETGRIEKYYWLKYINTSLDLQNSFKTLKGKKIKIEYVEEELMDSRIMEYRIFKYISTLELAD